MAAVMRPHGGMRPQDIVVLLRLVSHHEIISVGEKKVRMYSPLTAKKMSAELLISQAEIGHSIRRSRFAGLLNGSDSLMTVEVARQALYDFLVYGLKVVFPVQPGRLTRGVPTAHSAPPLNQIIQAASTDQYVWPHEDGEVRGQAIEPLFRTVPAVARQNEQFYQMLALTDALRIGRSREVNLARQELGKLLGVKS